MPGLLAAGIGTLIFIGLTSWTGYGTQSLAIPDIPPFVPPTVAEFLWAIGIGLAAAVLGSAIRRAALMLQPIVEQRLLLLMPIAGFGDRGAGGRLRAVHRSDASAMCSSPARTPCRD